MIHFPNILLASNSPRRRELLRQIAPNYAIAQIRDVAESYPQDMPIEQVPAYLSKLKADAYREDLVENEIIITADTVVISDGKILGKPKDMPQAIDMLESIMGRTHTVVTGVTLTSLVGTDTFSTHTEVTFDNVSREELEWYVDTYRPYDKAGAYGIQEWIGCVGIIGIKGCFYNVMGLPLHDLYLHLRPMAEKVNASVAEGNR